MGKGKNPKKYSDTKQQNTPADISKKITNISDAFLEELKGAFDNFFKMPESHRIKLYGDTEYLDQFWAHFVQMYPNLLDKIDKKDLPIYIEALKDKGFSLHRILDENENLKLHSMFASKDTEEHIIVSSLKELQSFCKDDINNVPADTFSNFAKAAGFNPTTFEIYPDGKIQNIEDISGVWKKFLENEKISLGTAAMEHSERILIPEYTPIERMMVAAAIQKIASVLTGSLKTAFKSIFFSPVSIHTSYQDLINFKTAWIQFVDDHAAEIDVTIAKKLDAIDVTNGDIQQELQKEFLKTGRKFDDTKGFSEWENYFKRIFNKLVTRQLFEEVEKTGEAIEHYVDAIGNTFNQFPPYVNEILNIYTFDSSSIGRVDSTFVSDLNVINAQIVSLNQQFSSASDEEKNELRTQRKILEAQKKQREWQGYIAFLRTKDAVLADVFTQLVAHNFDFAVLTVDKQQHLVTTLVEHKLKDTIKNKIPELLSVSEDDLNTFVHDFFDLTTMDVSLPTKNGAIPLHFTKKLFLGGARKTLPSINDLNDEIRNLPLNFELQLTDLNADFFEKSVIFDSLYTDFNAKNGNFRVNDAYQVKITKNGKTVTGYLSAYCPINEKYNDKEYTGKELFLYSSPITSPSDERTLITWPAEKDERGLPVVIKNDADQKSCEMEIIDKKININGDAFGALLFGYVLGEQSMNKTISPAQEQALSKKFSDLQVYKDKAEEEDEPAVQPSSLSKQDESQESSEYQKFINGWKDLKGYSFSDSEHQENGGFVEGSRMYVSHGDSVLYPKLEGKAWMYIDIIAINKEKGTFTVKFHGGELGLGSSEGVKKELPLRLSAFDGIKKAFGDIYKMPNPKGSSMEDQIEKIQSSGLAKDIEKRHLGNVRWESGNFKFATGDFSGEKVTHFGWYEAGIGEEYDKEVSTNYSLYEIEHNSNHTITLSGVFMDKEDGKDVKRKYVRDMDYPTFLLFIKEKGLQPKSKTQAAQMQNKQKIADQEAPKTKRGYSIGNIMSFFKDGISKLNSSIKKYDDERSEELTDILTKNGQLWNTLGGYLSPFSRISTSFELMGTEYFSERDSRVWKKIEKWQKLYEDGDFSLIYNTYLKPMIDGKIVITPHYKAAAMLLVMIKKGKGPYNRNPEFAAKGMRVNMLLGPNHQKRYLAMREKMIRELEQGSAVYGGTWTDNKKNEILELEMKYMVHVMDARQLGTGDDDKNYFYAKYSQKFVGELEGAYTDFFKTSVEVKKDASFDFARAEYFRLLGDRPQQAMSFLKTMAVKATNDSQWKIFEMAVMAGMISGIFLTMTMSDTQGIIKKICRTKGFVPGIRVKDIHQQAKLQRMLDLFSNGKFSDSKFVGKGDKAKKYSTSVFSYRDMGGGTKDCVSGFETWMKKDDNLNRISDFFKLTGKDNANKQTLLDIYADKDTPLADKELIKEFLDNSNEKYEGLDSELRDNPSAFAGSILTRSQSTVHQMMRFDNNGFAGKDGDEIQTMQGFFNDMKDSIPRKERSPEEVKIFMNKFFNWFEEKGFSGSNKTEFLKRLKYCQTYPHNPEVDDILYYSIVGQVCSSFNRFYLPDEFRGALEAWKDFFKANLDTILTQDIVESSFGGASYYEDYKRIIPEFEPWNTASPLLDKFESQMYIATLPTQEEKDAAREKKRQLGRSGGPSINGSLYTLAENLERNNVLIPNKFKNIYRPDNSSSSSSSPKVTGAKIKNPEVLHDLQQILEGKQVADTTVIDQNMPFYDPYDLDY